MIAVRLLEAARFYVPIVILWRSTEDRLEGGWALLVTVLFWCYTYARLQSVVADWWSTTYRVTPQGIRFATGVLARREVAASWDAVSSVQASRPFLHRLLRCSTVRIATGSQDGRVVLEAVPDAVAREVEELYRAGRPSHALDGGRDAGAPKPTVGAPGAGDRESGAPVYVIGRLDYLLISLTYGQFVLFVPVVLGVYSDVSQWVRLPAPDLTGLYGGALPWWSLALAGIATFVLAMAYGCAVAWLRYRSFTVHVEDSGVSVSGGFLTQERQQIRQASLGGLRFEQNPLMRVTGAGKLSLVSREPGRRAGTNVVFPVLSLPRLGEQVADIFPAYAGMFAFRPASRRALGGVLAGLAVAVLCAGGLVVHAVRPGSAVVVIAGLALATLVVANRVWTAADVDTAQRSIRYRRGFLWVRQYELPVSSVHVASQGQGPVGRRLSVSHVSLWIYDGRRVRLRVWACPAALAGRLTAAVQGSGQAVRSDLLPAAGGRSAGDEACGSTAVTLPGRAHPFG